MKKISLILVSLYAAALCFGLWKSLSAKSYFGSGFVFNFMPLDRLNEHLLVFWFSSPYIELFLGNDHHRYLVADAALSFLEFCIIIYAAYAFLQLRRQRRAKSG